MTDLSLSCDLLPLDPSHGGHDYCTKQTFGRDYNARARPPCIIGRASRAPWDVGVLCFKPASFFGGIIGQHTETDIDNRYAAKGLVYAVTLHNVRVQRYTDSRLLVLIVRRRGVRTWALQRSATEVGASTVISELTGAGKHCKSGGSPPYW